MILLVDTARTFGVRPSSFLSDIGGYTALGFDMAASVYVRNLSEGKRPADITGDELFSMI